MLYGTASARSGITSRASGSSTLFPPLAERAISYIIVPSASSEP